jgi:hypothetical protein
MTVPTTPHVMAPSPSVAASPTNLSDDANDDDEEEEAPVFHSILSRVLQIRKGWLEGLKVSCSRWQRDTTDSLSQSTWTHQLLKVKRILAKYHNI